MPALRLATRLLTVLAALALSVPAANADPGTLTVVAADGTSHSFAAAALLARPDVETLRAPDDPAYGAASPAYRAIPLAKVMADLPVAGADVLKAVALDGFVAQLPAGKALNADPAGAVAYLAIEDPARPWPKLPGKDVSAGPFYVVWAHPKRSGIGPEAWPYQTARLELTSSVASRYPEILVDPALAADHPARRGQEVFVDNCFVCHRMNGGGEASIGPDLNLPMNPTEYFQAAALRTYIRDPKAVRDWDGQAMPGFGPGTIGDADLDALIGYLGHMTGRR